jgi:hypothetical protein
LSSFHISAGILRQLLDQPVYLSEVTYSRTLIPTDPFYSLFSTTISMVSFFLTLPISTI